MKKIKTINKLLSSLTLLSPLVGVGFNNQHQNTQKVITENNSVLNSYFNSVGDQRTMGDITVNVEGTTITDYVSGEGKLVVDSDITEIAQLSFAFQPITSVDLTNADSLTTIGENAFEECWDLTGDLFIPQNLTSISNIAFSGVTKFTSITVDPLNKNFSLATNLGPKAKVLISGTDGFWNDNSIVSIALGDITIPSSVTNIGTSAFLNTEISSLDLSQATSLTTIGNQAFYYCTNLTGNITIPSSVTSIGDFAFWCVNITSLDLTEATSLTTIGNSAFQNCPITNIIIPSSVTTIGEGAFRHSISISQNSTLDLSQATSLTTIGEYAFRSCLKSSGNIIIPSNVASIGQFVFESNTIDNLYFLSETPPTSFGANWQPTVTGKVYVPSEQAKSKYTSAQNFGFTEDQIEIIGVSGKALINIDEKSAGSEQYATIAGFNATKWEIVMIEEEQPEWLSIDNQGILSWTDQCAVGTYKFKIKATNELQTSVESTPITFVVNESIKPEPKTLNIPLILGLLILLGIPIILAIAFIIWNLTKKKKTTVKI